MEKINPPLGELYENICNKITRVNSLLYGKKPQRNLNTRHDLERKLMTLKEIKSHIKTLLPAEREVIEKAFEYGQDMVEVVSHEWRDDLS